jgi:two-component system, cell cycle sensor histidine kinase and response regulator CckA
MNLAVNARDAMPRGGILTIETCNVELDGHSYLPRTGHMKPGKYVALVVGDNGSGMDAETLAHLFEPFFTTKMQGQGTGLGMTTVFSIVKQSGGGMEVFERTGKGTSVKVYLPRIDQPPRRRRSSPGQSGARLRNHPAGRG